MKWNEMKGERFCRDLLTEEVKKESTAEKFV